ncbi:MAG: cysteine-rich CWC family protein [Bacteroidales bacterium]|nr:cysteine-rich CWC family protein [Bacteroidales bacterium]
MKVIANKTCPSCGKAFSCPGEDDCWCEKVQLHKKDMLFIMENYNDCLCPECLGRFEEK